MTSVLILGAASDIARALARAYAVQGCNLILAARRIERLDPDKIALSKLGAAEIRVMDFDILDPANIQIFLNTLGSVPDVVICAVGLLVDRFLAETNTLLAEKVMRTNYLGPALILDQLSQSMERRKSGLIIGISSVAGDRGRASNYIYGSAKAGFTAFLAGLRQRLASHGVHVMTVKPGFVRTKMTANMKLPKILTASPDEVAAAILKAVERKKNVIYVYPVWRLIMLVIGHIPEGIFKKVRF